MSMRTVVSLIFVTAIAANIALWVIFHTGTGPEAPPPAVATQYEEAHAVAEQLYANEAKDQALQAYLADQAVIQQQRQMRAEQAVREAEDAAVFERLELANSR